MKDTPPDYEKKGALERMKKNVVHRGMKRKLLAQRTKRRALGGRKWHSPPCPSRRVLRCCAPISYRMSIICMQGCTSTVSSTTPVMTFRLILFLVYHVRLLTMSLHYHHLGKSHFIIKR